MDPLHLAIALCPLAVYLFLLGMVNLGQRPYVTNGARDAAALGVGVAGLVVAGPLELFFPESMAFHLGAYVWLLLLGLCGLCLTLFVLLMRPRLVIYNIDRDQLRPLLAALVADLDRDARWAGESLVIPKLGVQLCVETSPGMRIVQLVAAGPQQNYDGWRRLERALALQLRQTRSERNSMGVTLIGLSALLLVTVTFLLVRDPAAVAQAFHEMLRI
jgi:hypothetical protein